MKIIAQKNEMLSASEELLRLSRELRGVSDQTAYVGGQLRFQTEFEACQRELRKQEQDLSQLTARMVGLSSALREIARLYGQTEERNADAMEGGSRLYRVPAEGALYVRGVSAPRWIDKIIY